MKVLSLFLTLLHSEWSFGHSECNRVKDEYAAVRHGAASILKISSMMPSVGEMQGCHGQRETSEKKMSFVAHPLSAKLKNMWEKSGTGLGI